MAAVVKILIVHGPRNQMRIIPYVIDSVIRMIGHDAMPEGASCPLTMRARHDWTSSFRLHAHISTNEAGITWNQTWIQPPGLGFKEESKEVREQHRRGSHDDDDPAETLPDIVRGNKGPSVTRSTSMFNQLLTSHTLIITGLFSQLHKQKDGHHPFD